MPLRATEAPHSVLMLNDAQRQPAVPVEVYLPANATLCETKQPCQVAIFGARYGIGYLDYSFIANTLSRLGYLVVSVEYEHRGHWRRVPQRHVRWRRRGT